MCCCPSQSCYLGTNSEALSLQKATLSLAELVEEVVVAKGWAQRPGKVTGEVTRLIGWYLFHVTVSQADGGVGALPPAATCPLASAEPISALGLPGGAQPLSSRSSSEAGRQSSRAGVGVGEAAAGVGPLVKRGRQSSRAGVGPLQQGPCPDSRNSHRLSESLQGLRAVAVSFLPAVRHRLCTERTLEPGERKGNKNGKFVCSQGYH
ncbi:hypothetical protein P7K49_025637 [Saguinus oedipus]|uniref:Uncharacterized protein n=1 Tax=Saguinus oedipus TaxID=9490 RepID=A0ABQ9UHQ9_SAGOE|nr:hypothetical protein P7K49_025637 [Saguinus oedipus]